MMVFLQIHFEWKVGHVKLSATALGLDSLISQQLSHYASPNRARHLDGVLYIQNLKNTEVRNKGVVRALYDAHFFAPGRWSY